MSTSVDKREDAPYVPVAFRWLRAYTPEQNCLCSDVRSVWEYLFRERPDSGHAYPLHVRGAFRRFCAEFHDSNGRNIEYHVVARTLLLEYTMQVYRRALQLTEKRYPGWNAHRYVDGPLLGERRLEWLSKTFPFGWSYLEGSIYQLINDEAIAARESISCEACNSWGELPGEFHRFDSYGTSEYQLIRLCIDVDEISQKWEDSVKAALKAGQLPTVGHAEKAFSYQEVRKNLVTVSDPEIALINRADARVPLSEADRALCKACEKLNEAGIEAALAQGANINVIDEYEQTPLLTFVQANGYNRYELYETDEEDDDPTGSYAYPPVPLSEEDELRILHLLLRHGAHPDLAGHDELTPLAQAAMMRCPHIVKALLQVGADAGVHSFFDRSFAEWPDAWDYATTDAHLYGGLYHQVVAELENSGITPYGDEKDDVAQ